jgi:DivIVA domain-containing protein
MESTDTPRSALDEIKTVAFKQGIRGYVVDEVDEFLDRAAAEVDQIREQMHQLRQQLRQASERIRQLESGAPAPAPVPAPAPAPAPVVAPTPVAAPVAAATAPSTLGAEQVTAMIAMAQQFIEQAQQEAETKAREMTVAAQERAREIVAEARSRAEDEVTRLNGLKQRLSEDVATLTRQLDAERTRVTTVLSELSAWIESSLHVGAGRPAPAASPAPAAPPAPAPQSTAPTAVADTAPRPVAPPPAPQATIGQVLNFEPPSDYRA